MSEDTDMRDLERRLTKSLHTMAPRPDPGLADRLMSMTAATPQRRGFMAFFSAAPLLAAAAVILVALAVGIGFGILFPRAADVGDASQTPAPTAAPSTTDAPATEPPPSPTDEVLPGSQRCVNESIGFAVRYPADWWANEVVDADAELDAIPACLYFAEDPVELTQNAGLPAGIAIVADIDERPAGVPEEGVEVVETHDATVAGQPATVEEVEWTEDTVFQRSGDRAYRYRIPLADGETLLFATVAQQPSEQYEARKAVLDGMMETMELPES
jgi:hypothetical protein